MSEKALFETMSAETGAERDRRLAEARREATSIMSNARSRSVQLRESTLKATHSEVDELGRRSHERAEAEAQKASLTMRHTVAEEVLATVEAEIETLVSSADFPELLDALLDEALAARPKGPVAVIAPETQADHCRKWLEDHGHEDASVTGSAEFWDGVAVQDENRTYRISNTLTGRFSILEGTARKECISKLFGSN